MKINTTLEQQQRVSLVKPDDVTVTFPSLTPLISLFYISRTPVYYECTLNIQLV